MIDLYRDTVPCEYIVQTKVSDVELHKNSILRWCEETGVHAELIETSPINIVFSIYGPSVETKLDWSIPNSEHRTLFCLRWASSV